MLENQPRPLTKSFTATKLLRIFCRDNLEDDSLLRLALNRTTYHDGSTF